MNWLWFIKINQVKEDDELIKNQYSSSNLNILNEHGKLIKNQT